MKKPISDWDAYRYSFVKQTLRRSSFRWPPRGEALRAARTSQKPNPVTGRLCWHVSCAGCKQEILEKEAQLDHVEPVIDILPSVRNVPFNKEKSEVYLGTLVLKMFPVARGFQVLCETCHKTKTRGENHARLIAKKSGSKG